MPPLYNIPFDLNAFEETFSTPAACDAGLSDVTAQMETLSRFMADQYELNPEYDRRPHIHTETELRRLWIYLKQRKAQLLRDPNAPVGSFRGESVPGVVVARRRD